MYCSPLSLCPVLAQWALCQTVYTCHCDGRVHMSVQNRRIRGAFTSQGYDYGNVVCVHECVIDERKECKEGLA